jgi:hypothetical protein
MIAVEQPANVNGQAARKVVDKLIRVGLLEEVRAGGSLPIRRRDDDNGPMALRITKAGLQAIDAGDAAMAAREATSAHPTPAREVETAAPKATASRKRISVAAQKSASKKRHAGKAKGTTGFNHFRSKSTTRASVRPAMRDCAMM